MYDTAVFIFKRIRAIHRYVPLIELLGMLKSTDSFDIVEDDKQLSITFVLHKKPVKHAKL